MNRHLSARQAFLLRAAARPQGADMVALAEQLGVSRRTLQRDLRAVAAYLDGFGASLASDEAGIWRLAGPAAAIDQAVRGAPRARWPLPLGPADRAWLVAAELLAAGGPVKLAYFSRRLDLAPASVSHLLDGLEEWFAQYHLRLVRRRGYGVEVAGEERQRRLVLAELVHDRIRPEDLMLFLRDPVSQTSAGAAHAAGAEMPDARLDFLVRFFGPEEVKRVYQVVSAELSELDPPLDEAGFASFLLHVLIALARLREGRSLVDAPADEPALHQSGRGARSHARPREKGKAARGSRTEAGGANSVRIGVDSSRLQDGIRLKEETRDRRLVGRILEQLAPDAAGLAWEAEAADLVTHLRGAKVQLTQRDQLLPANVTALEFAHRLAESIGRQVGVPLQADRQFTTALAQHLEPAMHRMAAGLSIRNPLLDEVRRRYPGVYAATLAASREVFATAKLDVPAEEVGFLAMHVGAALERLRVQQRPRARIVCPNGISSAELLASRVRAELPQLEIVGVGAAGHGQALDCDLILSTVPADAQEVDVPVVVVSPFLTQEEIDSVRAAINELTARPQRTGVEGVPPPSLRAAGQPMQGATPRHPSPTARRWAEPGLDVWSTSASCVEDLVQQISLRVQDLAGASAALVREALWQRERQGSVVLPGAAMALLHARTVDLCVPYIGVVRLREAVFMRALGEHPEPVRTVLVLLAHQDEPPAVLQRLGRLSRALVEDPQWVIDLHAADAEDLTAKARRIMETQE
ncbi:BglG family transcription antiterminator [Alicyclobacillus kakegawensis]|uniref:BglG family transcription antiterminator n=1 Tax=Alicyclobacillus kakegawensis TaxID=392012 RepID=UPI0008309998|nr:PRD domain-containing protein [Alicyclobacillus kakegawensis]